MSWRVALIDSCGGWPGVVDLAAFVSEGQHVERRAPVADPSGHGSRIIRLLAGGEAPFELLLGQVFVNAGSTTGAAVAAAIAWAVERRANLVHLSLGLEADRAVLAAAVGQAVAVGCIVVASTPARGAPVYPAAYPDVIRATGDARCAPGELSCLGPWLFGGCPRIEGSGYVGTTGGASVGAAWITRAIVNGVGHATASAAVAALAASSRYIGPERKGSVPLG